MSEKRAKELKTLLTKAATKAATEATLKERARCLWVLDAILIELQEKLPKVMLNEQQRHMQELKIKIAMAYNQSASLKIVQGEEPPKPEEVENGIDR